MDDAAIIVRAERLTNQGRSSPRAEVDQRDDRPYIGLCENFSHGLGRC